MLLAESIANKAVVNATPFRAAWENSDRSYPHDAVRVDKGDADDLQLLLVDLAENCGHHFLPFR
jgi:hypothetical protein